GLPAGAAIIIGDSITLTSSDGGVGTSTAPLVIATHGTPLAGGGVQGGVVTVSALNDIGLEQDTGDLIINSISSTAGDVFVNVKGGGIFDSRGQTPAQVLSDAQIQQ